MRLQLATFNVENLFTRFYFPAFSDRFNEKYLPPIVQFYGESGHGDLTKFEEFKRFVVKAAVSQDDYRLEIKVSTRADDNGQYPETIKVLGDDKPSGIDPLVDDGFGVNTLELLPQNERWTHYYPAARHKTQLDCIIASPKLEERIQGGPEVIRHGMPYRVPNTDHINRYPRIGWDRTKASDHCPVVVQFDI